MPTSCKFILATVVCAPVTFLFTYCLASLCLSHLQIFLAVFSNSNLISIDVYIYQIKALDLYRLSRGSWQRY